MTLCDDCCRSCKNRDFVAKCDTFLSLYAWRDHMALLSWINYSAHKCSVGHANINFDGRDAIVLPSGKKIDLIISVVKHTNINFDFKDCIILPSGQKIDLTTTVVRHKDEPVSEVPEQ